jgi:membrane fusion protein (multidrug efflux system)
LLLAALLLAGCNQDAALAPSPLPEVAVLTAEAETITPDAVLPGRLEAWREAEVRAQVAGVVQQRQFIEGSDVEAGQVLFVIDPAPYRASYARAEAELARAEAQALQARSQRLRIEKLYSEKLVSEQSAVDARAMAQQAEAEVAAAKATREAARIDVDHATVKAPIAGRIGRAFVTEGALVGEDEATPMAVIQQLDPIYATFSQSANELLALRRLAGAEQAAGLPVQLILDGGHDYAHPGRLLFAGASVDPQTARVTLRAELPNPDRLLLPGMPVRMRVPQARLEGVFRVPQQAVTRDEHGDFMKVLDAQHIVHTRQVRVLQALDNDWLISEGLQTGELFVVEGFQKIRPEQPVNPVTWQR